MKLTEGTPEWYQWGADEAQRRSRELRNAKDAIDLARVQLSIKARREAVGLSADEAVKAMGEAKRKGIRPQEGGK